MRAFIDSTFSKNIAANAAILSNSPDKNFSALTDNNNSTFWTTEKGTTTASIEFKFSEEQVFDCVMLQENFRNGQRVEAFEIQAEIDGKFVKVTEGTTIGYKRLLRFNPVVTNRVQFVITASRDCPEISTFGLFKMPID